MWQHRQMLCRGTSIEVCDQPATKRLADPDGGLCQRHYRQWKNGQTDQPFVPARQPREHVHRERARGEVHRSAKLTEDAVRKLRAMRGEGYTYPQLAALFGVHEQTARKAVQGRTWGHV